MTHVNPQFSVLNSPAGEGQCASIRVIIDKIFPAPGSEESAPEKTYVSALVDEMPAGQVTVQTATIPERKQAQTRYPRGFGISRDRLSKSLAESAKPFSSSPSPPALVQPG